LDPDVGCTVLALESTAEGCTQGSLHDKLVV
jgi:hypothetical protein